MRKDTSATKVPAPSTVGRGKAIVMPSLPKSEQWCNESVSLYFADSLTQYTSWQRPTVIISDGAYGVLGFEGDTSDHQAIQAWYEPHIKAWSKSALPCTTLWLWNSEIGWASLHPILEKHGWRYIGVNVWDKGKGHIAGNVNSASLRQFPIVTEVCVQYVFEPQINGLSLKQWLISEWKRTGLPKQKANEACGVKNAATRKYFDQGHLWYFPPPDKFDMLVQYANTYGKVDGKPYFSMDGIAPLTGTAWARMRSKFYCPYGITNVWQRPPLRDNERVKLAKGGRAVHLNQKPLDLMERIILASSDPNDVIWEPFGGLFSGAYAAMTLGRRAYAAEIDSTYFQYGVARFQP